MTIKKTRLLLFFDTEFTHFVGIDLISIGVVSQHGHEFYAENADYQKTWCSDFVNSVALPKLQGGEYAMPYPQLQVKIQSWISALLEIEPPRLYRRVICLSPPPWQTQRIDYNTLPQLQQAECFL